MFTAMFIITTMMYGVTETPDPKGPLDTLEQCQAGGG